MEEGDGANCARVITFGVELVSIDVTFGLFWGLDASELVTLEAASDTASLITVRADAFAKGFTTTMTDGAGALSCDRRCGESSSPSLRKAQQSLFARQFTCFRSW